MSAKPKVNLLEVVPVRRTHIKTEWIDDCAVIVYPRFKYGWMNRYLLPKGLSPDIRVTLEEHGSMVWQLIDGHNSIDDIIKKLAIHFNHETNYESRIVTYIAQLHKDGFIIYSHPFQP